MNDKRIWGIAVTAIGLLCFVGAFTQDEMSVHYKNSLVYQAIIFVTIGTISFFLDSFIAWRQKYILAVDGRANGKPKSTNSVQKFFIWLGEIKTKADVNYNKRSVVKSTIISPILNHESNTNKNRSVQKRTAKKRKGGHRR